MLPHCSHIARKRGVYYFRRRLPRPARGEIAVSLGTRCFREAQHLAELLDRGFTRIAKAHVDDSELQNILGAYLRARLAEDRQRYLETPSGRPVYGTGYGEHDDPIDADLEALDIQLDLEREALARRDLHPVRDDIAELAERHHVPAHRHVELGLGILQARVLALEVALKRVRGQAVDPMLPMPAAGATPHPVRPVEASSAKLSEEMDRYIATMQRDPVTAWREQTLAQNRATFRMLLSVCPDKPATSYTRADLTRFQDVLGDLPALWDKAVRWKGKAIEEIAREAASDRTIPKLAVKTIKRHFGALGGLFEFVKGRNDGFENPAHRRKFGRTKSAATQRDQWTTEQLTLLFRSPVWVGAKSEWVRSQRGDVVIRDAKYWLPILSLCHGNRLEEFAQLTRGDVIEEGGAYCFDINDEGAKQLKNEQSRRRVPMHPAVVRLGFLRYVDRVAPQAGDSLFPELTPQGPDAKRGTSITKWFGRYRREIGIADETVVFHSLRHTFTTRAAEAGVSEVMLDALTGHRSTGETMGRYTKAKSFALSTLHAEISKVRFPELDHLVEE